MSSVCEAVGERGAGSNKRWFPQVLKAGHPGSCLSCMFICIMLDTSFCGWFNFLSLFLLYTLASML